MQISTLVFQLTYSVLNQSFFPKEFFKMSCILEYTLEILEHTVNQFFLASSLPSKSTQNLGILFLFFRKQNFLTLEDCHEVLLVLSHHSHSWTAHWKPLQSRCPELKTAGGCAEEDGVLLRAGGSKEPFESKGPGVSGNSQAIWQHSSQEVWPGGSERLSCSQKQIPNPGNPEAAGSFQKWAAPASVLPD